MKYSFDFPVEIFEICYDTSFNNIHLNGEDGFSKIVFTAEESMEFINELREFIDLVGKKFVEK